MCRDPWKREMWYCMQIKIKNIQEMTMRRIAKFHKVSREQFAEGWKDTFGEVTEEEINTVYDSIKLPKRATAGSAGYDFYSPLSFELKPGETVKIPTGVRAEMDEG